MAACQAHLSLKRVVRIPLHLSHHYTKVYGVSKTWATKNQDALNFVALVRERTIPTERPPRSQRAEPPLLRKSGSARNLTRTPGSLTTRPQTRFQDVLYYNICF
jgi:hypothetical protein